MGLKRFICVLVLLLAATSAQAQTNPLGAGYSLSHGQLFVQTAPSLNLSLTQGFSISINAVVPTVTTTVMDALITSNPSNSGLGGFFLGYGNTSSSAFQLNSSIWPSAQAAGSPACTHSGQVCWRFNFLQDGNRHNVCARWTSTAGYLYLDGILRDITTSPTLSGPYTNTKDLYWSLGANAPTTWTLYDARAYTSDIGAAGCVTLANYAAQGVYPTTGPLSTGMALHLPMDSTAAPCATAGGQWSCADTSGNGNTATNGSLSPTVSITSPTPSQVSGTVPVAVSCTLTGGSCSQVCYYMDGYLLACSSTGPTFNYSWNSTLAIDGAHTLGAVAYSVSGNSSNASPIAVTVHNNIVGVVYQFDGVNGVDTGSCVAPNPCKTSSKFNSLTYKGGDTIQFNNATTFTSDSGIPPTICGPASGANCALNFYPSSTPLTITKYGSGTCNPLTGNSTVVPSNCAHIVSNASGKGFQLWNANKVIVQNMAFTGNGGSVGIAIDATDVSTGGSSDSVTIQNNYVFNFGVGGAGIATNVVKANRFTDAKLAGHITNCLIQDNYVTAPGVNGSGVGPTTSPDAGIVTLDATTCIVQGNLQENAGANSSNSQGNGIKSENYPNPGGSTTRNIIQFNVTHNNGGNYTQNIGGPYSLYAINADYTTMQFNEEYNQQCWVAPTGFPACNALTNGPDNGGADIDEGSTHVVMQYNYIHNNVENFSNAMLMFSGIQSAVWGNPGWGDNWYRYNIVENYFVGMAFSVNSNPTIGGNKFYNNTLSSNISNPTASTAGGNQKGTCITASGLNNLCINTAASGFQFYVSQFTPFCTGIDYNDFYSPTHQDYWAAANGTLFAATGNLNSSPTNGGMAAWVTACSAGAHNLNVNPVLAGTPGTGGTCWPGGTTPPAGPTQPPSAAKCPSVYQLTSGSTAVMGHGVAVDSSPTPNVTVDFYGNAVPNNGSCGGGSGYNIGADGACH